VNWIVVAGSVSSGGIYDHIKKYSASITNRKLADELSIIQDSPCVT